MPARESGRPREKGFHHERLALRYLRKQGLSLLETNFYCRAGEIDLILRDGDTIVFAEIRFRGRRDYGNPLETIGQRKRSRLIRTASLYLLQRGLYEKSSCRFDVLGISPGPHGLEYQWIKNAFQQD